MQIVCVFKYTRSIYRGLSLFLCSKSCKGVLLGVPHLRFFVVRSLICVLVSFRVNVLFALRSSGKLGPGTALSRAGDRKHRSGPASNAVENGTVLPTSPGERGRP